MEKFKFFTIFAISCVILWYVCEGILWLEFLFVPYTEFKRTLAIWIHHIVFLTYVPFWFTLAILADLSRAKKKKRG